MAWADCPTHGPIQDANAVEYGPRSKTPGKLYCRCGLECAEYLPEEFVEHEELVELEETGTQPGEVE